MVFRAEGKFDRVAADGRADGASDGWAGDLALALVGEDRQECLSYFGRDAAMAVVNEATGKSACHTSKIENRKSKIENRRLPRKTGSDLKSK